MLRCLLRIRDGQEAEISRLGEMAWAAVQMRRWCLTLGLVRAATLFPTAPGAAQVPASVLLKMQEPIVKGYPELNAARLAYLGSKVGEPDAAAARELLRRSAY